MKTTVRLREDIAARFENKAKARGISTDQLLSELIGRDLSKIEIPITTPQRRLFELIAAGSGASAADVILAFACDRAEMNPGGDGDALGDLQGVCWRYAHAGEVPPADHWLNDAEKADLDAVIDAHAKDRAAVRGALADIEMLASAKK
jgi:hypothetical protein